MEEYIIDEQKQQIDRDEILINMSRDMHPIKNMLLFFVILMVLEITFALSLENEMQNFLEILPSNF